MRRRARSSGGRPAATLYRCDRSHTLGCVKLDAFITGLAIEDAGAYAQGLEASGYHGLWVTETKVDPLLPLAVAATTTRAMRLGTGITVALARSPMVTAMDAWAIQRASRGRLDLGLGTQVRAHIERRFAMPYDRPAARMKEYAAALRHIWGAFQHEHRLAFKGDFYSFTPTYRAVLAHHGWDAVGEELPTLARAGRLDELPRLVTEPMLEAFVTRAKTYAELGQRIRERYEGVLDRVGLYGDATKIDRESLSALTVHLRG